MDTERETCLIYHNYSNSTYILKKNYVATLR